MKLKREDYSVGWICPLEVEQIAALQMLDEHHDSLPQPATDHNVYNLGSIAGHNVVVAGLPQAGNNPAAAVVTLLKTTFPNVRFGLLVGIGGGVPVRTDNGMIRLGDVVVSKPSGVHSGAVQYDHGKAWAGEFQRTGAIAPPPAVLLNAAQDLATKRAMEREDAIRKNIRRIDTSNPRLRHFTYPGASQDHLYKADYVHVQRGVSCDECGCDASQRIVRPADEDDDPYVTVHRGTIASGEMVLKDAILRDQLAIDGLLCFDMEAAGALTEFPCIVIRGVSDYCDSHKNDVWHGYAAAAAAAYARQLFFHMPIDEVQRDIPIGSGFPSYPLNALGPVKTFVERPALLKKIREQLKRENDTPFRPIIVGVWGSGGMGKTQLVLSYLQHYRDNYDATFWIQARQTSSIDRDFMDIYRQLPRAALTTAETPEDVRREVLKWFAATSGKWLLVFDGADQLDKSNRDYVDLSLYIPGCRTAHVIITSRIAAVRKLSTFEGVQVGELDEAQAAMLFRYCAELEQIDEKTETEAKKIIHELGYLPLAISIAGTYISQTPRLSSNLSGYLDEYQRQRHRLLAEQPDELVDKYGHSVMTVWETSYSAVEEQLPLACQLLNLLAFINYEDIFLGIFGLNNHQDASLNEKPWTVIFGNHQLNYYDLEKCFTTLERYSLIQRQTNATSYTMHRLVHAWDQDRLLRSMWKSKLFCLAALEMLFEAMVGSVDLPESKLRLVPHLRSNIDSLIQLGIGSSTEEKEIVDLIEHVGSFTAEIGSWKEAAIFKRQVLKMRQEILGDEHASTISAMNNLAITLAKQGDLDHATSIFKEVVNSRQRMLGAEHPDTISAMNNLANTLGDQGKLEEAAVMRKEVLEKMQRILGDEHPDTISAMNNFANTLRDHGKLEEAATMLKEVLEKCQRILGDEHPFTISAINNLACTLRDQGKLEEAAVMKREVIEKRQRILGDEHPSTISAIYNLANTLGDQGKLEEAAVMKKKVLEKMQRILGDEHPYTISAMNNLACTLGDQGKLEEAAKMLKEVLKKRQRILGDEHPYTISVRDNLACTLGDQGKLEEAAIMKKEVLEKMQRILGDDHPDTISAMNNLANTLGDQGKLEEAAAMGKEVLEKRQRILGDDHPDTISAMNNLANTLGDQGKLEEAAVMKKEVLKQYQRILGDEHPDTISAMNNLALTFKNQGKLEEAATMLKEVLKKCQRILGDEHPSTISAINNLAVALVQQGNLDDATSMLTEVVNSRQRILGAEHPDQVSTIHTLVLIVGI